MKFTEGYWEKNERANASYAMQAFTAEAIPGGMRIVSPFRQITDRGGALDVGTITTEFISALFTNVPVFSADIFLVNVKYKVLLSPAFIS